MVYFNSCISAGSARHATACTESNTPHLTIALLCYFIVAAACSRDKWGNGMQSQEAATSSTPAIPSTGPAQGAEVGAAPQEADKAAVTTTVAAAGAVTP
jgi:hypothetical protein